MEVLYTFIPIAIAAIIEAYFDAKVFNPEHKYSATVRVVCIALYSYLMIEGLLFQIAYLFMGLVLYSAVFDPAYNLWKGSKVWYIGKTATTDKIARKIVGGDGSLYLICKMIIFIATLTIYLNV
jgi:hypothetical protein